MRKARLSLRSMRNNCGSSFGDCATKDVETVAISFLHSYANQDHELAAAKIAADEFAFDGVSASCEVGRK